MVAIEMVAKVTMHRVEQSHYDMMDEISSRQSTRDHYSNHFSCRDRVQPKRGVCAEVPCDDFVVPIHFRWTSPIHSRDKMKVKSIK